MVEELEAVLEKLAAIDPQALADAEAVQRLHRCVEALEAVVTRSAAAFEASGRWQGDGARSAAAWLAGRCRVPKAAASRRLRLGRALRHLPVAEPAWLAGAVGTAQVAILARARTPGTEAAMARDEAVLVANAAGLRFDHFARALAYWAQRADPAGAEEAAERRRDGRRLHLSQSFGGAWVLDAMLDPVAGQVVGERLRAIEAELFEADRARARCERGEHPGGAEPGRTPASAGPTPWWRWPPGPGPCPPVPAAPSPCSRSSWAMRPSWARCARWPGAPR